MYSHSLGSSFQTPEQAQKAVNDYLSLKDEQSAFDVLINFMSGKRSRQWSPALEEIMVNSQIKMIDLSIILNKTTMLKEPLNNYKFVSQHSNITSLESVLEYLCIETEKKHEPTANLAIGNEKLLSMEDIDNDDVDELFISSLKNENMDSRTEKDIIRNSWRCIWETYKTIIEIISRNKKLEEFYASIIKKAFEFCKKYKRRIEFKRFCDAMRSNLNNMIRGMLGNPDYLKIPFVIDLSNPETNEKQLQIRFDQLNYAYHFENWQEAIKILEDINSIMQRRKGTTAIKSKIKSDYFENLAKMFWKSEFYHYHASAFFTHYQILIRNKRLDPEELSSKSCNFVLSVLSIPPLMNEQYQSEDAKAKAISLISSESTVPPKSELVSWIVRHNILDLCTPEIKELFFLVEDDNDVLNLAKKSEPLLKQLTEQYKDFEFQLKNIIIFKILYQLSKLYTKLKISKFSQFIGSLTFSACENIIHLSSIEEYIKVRIDHRNQLLIFQNEERDLQSLSMKFVDFSDEVKEIVYSIEQKKDQVPRENILNKYREEARKYLESSQSSLNERKRTIMELKKPDREHQALVQKQEQENKELKAQQAKREQELEETKRLAEKKEIDKQTIMRKLEDATLAKKNNLINELKQLKGIKIDKKPFENLSQSDLDALTVEKLEKAKEQYKKEEKEKEENLIKKSFKKVDYTERARREAFVDILKKSWEETKNEKSEIIDIHKKNFDKLMDFKKKMETAKTFRENFAKKEIDKRKEAFNKELKEFKEKIISEFRKKILDSAEESLKKQKDDQVIQEAEIKRQEDELAKRKQKQDEEGARQAEQQKEAGFFRNTKTREELKSEEEKTEKTDKPEKKMFTGFSRSDKTSTKPEPNKVEEKPESKFFRSNLTAQKSEPPVKKFTNAKIDDKKPISVLTKTEVKKPEPTPSGSLWRSTK